MPTIFRKELADYFTSIRIIILFLLVFLASAAGLFAAYQGIRGTGTGAGFVFLRLFTTSGGVIPPLTFLIAFFIPIIGIILGFDAINSERSNGTLSRILSQPVYRDSVINAKFLAGIATLCIMILTTILLVSGYGLRMIGVAPSEEEIIRLFLYLVITVIYAAFWMGLAILFSVLFRRIASSALVSVALWLFFVFFWGGLIAPAIARTTEVALMLQRISPARLFVESADVLLQPISRGAGLYTAGEEISYMLFNPLSLGQSILLVWPHIVGLISLTAICFAVAYVLFMRQEIRAT